MVPLVTVQEGSVIGPDSDGRPTVSRTHRKQQLVKDPTHIRKVLGVLVKAMDSTFHIKAEV